VDEASLAAAAAAAADEAARAAARRAKHESVLQLRIISIVRLWIEDFTSDWRRDLTLRDKLNEFMRRVEPLGGKARDWINNIGKTLERALRRASGSSSSSSSSSSSFSLSSSSLLALSAATSAGVTASSSS